MFINAWRRFLGGLKKRINTGASQGRIRKRRPPLFLEPLERRIVLSTNTWLNPLGGSWNDPSNWSNAAIPTAADDVVINLPSAATIRLSGGAVSIHSLQVNNSLIIDGASLSVAGNVTNAGEIDLTSTNGSADVTLGVGGLLTNTSTGLLSSEPGAGGGRYIDGNIFNQGVIDAAGASVTILGAASGGPVFTQAGGEITTEGAGVSVVQGNGVFHYTGGALAGEYIVVGTELDVQSTVTATAVIEVRGQGNVLDKNASPNVTLRVEGTNNNGNGVLTAANGAVNNGVIDLDSIGSSSWNSDLYITSGGTFTNGPTGLIEVHPGAGGNRGIHGNWVNQGTVDVLAGASLGVWGINGAGANFTQAGGLLTAENGASLVQIGGIFRYTGGALHGEIVALNSELDVEATVTATALLKVRGQNNILDRNLAPGVTLWVQGSSYNGDGVLTALDGAVNAGVIDLESIQSDWKSSLLVAAGGTFTNAAAGVVAVNVGSGGGRSINGNVVNRGTVTANANEQWSGNVTNAGTVTVADGVEVDVNGASSILSQTGGALDVNGTLIVNGGAVDIEAGALNGGGTFLVQNVQLSFGLGAAGPLAVQAVGQGNILLNNLGAGVTVWVRGDDRFNQAELTVAPDAVNAGTILLESASSWWWSILSIQDALDNTSTGVIQVSQRAGGGRSIQGNLTNEGTILVDANASIEIDGNGNGGPTLTQNGGRIQADGRLLLNGGLFDFEGGAVAGNFYAENAQLYVSPDVTDPSLIHVVGGGDVLLDNASASTTLLVQGDDGFNAGVLTVAPDATNAGVIQLTSTSSYWGSVLAIQDMLDNTPTGQIVVAPGTGGVRSINGDIDNEGLVSVAAGANLDVNGANGTGPTFIQDGGSVQADGRLVQHGGLFDFESGDISGSFYVNNAQIYVSPDAVDPATVTVVGSDNTLLGNEGPGVTLRVEGDDGFNAGVLTAAAGAVNAGSIVLASTSAYWGSILAAPDTLLNAQGGLIAVADDDGGGGVRWLSGDFINAGTIFVPPDRQLTLQGGDPTLIQAGGLIAAAGSFVQDGGLFDFETGGVLGAFAVNGAAINIGPEVVAPNTIEVLGPGNTLLDNASAVTTLWVQGNDGYNAGVLTAAPGAFNAGTIMLASVSNTWGESLAAPGGFVNLAGGHIAVYGGGGPARLSGTLTNDGYLSLSGVGTMSIDALANNGTVGVDATGQADAPGVSAMGDADAAGQALVDAAAAGGNGSAATDPGAVGAAVDNGADGGGAGDAPPTLTRLTVGAWTNNGTVAVDAGTQLEVAPDGSGRDTFTQAGGLVAADGRLIIDGGLFHFSGGALMGAFTVRDGQIRVDSTAAQQSTIYVLGQQNVLLDNAGNAILRVQGGSPAGDGDAVLTAADASTNAGAIILETLDGVHHGYFRVPAGTFTNEAGGVIQVNLPPGDSGQGSITAGWLDGAGATADATGLPVLPQYQSLLDQLENDIANGIPVDPQLLQQALLMTQTPGVSDGVISAGGVGSNDSPAGGDGLVGFLTNDGGVLVQSLEAPFQTAGDILNGASGGLWYQDAVPAVTSAWQDVQPYVQDYALPAIGEAGRWVRQNVQPVIQQDVAPFIQGVAGRVAALPAGVVELGALIHDAVFTTLAANTRWWSPVLGTPEWQPAMWSSFSAGLRQAQAQGNGLEYSLNAALNAATFGLSGDVQSFSTAYAQAQATGSAAPLAAWAGGTAVDAAFSPLGAAALGAASSLVAEESPLGEAGAGVRLYEVTSSWSAETGLESGLGEAAVGERAATEAAAEADLSEATAEGETTAETAARAGNAADAGQLAEAEVNAAQVEATAREGLSGDAVGEKAAAVETATAAVQQAQQACLDAQGSPGGCFAAGIPLLTPDGGKPIESFKEKDQLFARNESDPNGPPILGTVEKVFVRMAPILEMRLEGQVIRTTAEHLFWVREKKAWTAAGDVQPGDQLLSHDGRWVTVQSVENTGRVETVYNLRVSDSHTYFVGGLSWGFAVWAHNACDFTPDQNDPGEWEEVNRGQAGLETQSAFSGQPINYDPITGQASIKEYQLGGVAFDGYSNGTLGEVKGDYSIVLEEWYIQAKGGAAAEELIGGWRDQAAAQVKVATQYGLPLEWYVPQDLLPLVQQVLGKNFPTITFVGY